MADTMKMEYKIFLEAEDVSQSRILSCASYMKRVLESCNNPYISRAELDDESDLDDFVLRLFVEEEIEEKECTNPAMAESFIEDMAELVTGIAEAHSFLDLREAFLSHGRERRAHMPLFPQAVMTDAIFRNSV